MKVLFISNARYHDYQTDCLWHGLATVLGEDVVDAAKMSFMYEGHGDGYTLYGLLPDLPRDRTDIPNKIKNCFFDLVIFGQIHEGRCTDYFNEVVAAYPPHRIFWCDGGDDDHTMFWDAIGKGVYFKREQSPAGGTIPIQFAVPREKIVSEVPAKTRLMAPLDPADRSTYGYVTEESYREMYAVSMFGKTMKKGGWDCMRHYEILMMGTVPYFVGLEQCPGGVMDMLPKGLLLDARNVLDIWPNRESEYPELAAKLLAYTREHLTTEALAKRVLSQLNLARSA